MPGFRIPTVDSCGLSSSPGGPVHVLETARKHRFILEVFEPLGTKSNGILLYGYKCNRPSIEFDEVLIHNSQDEIGRPGKQHWKPVEFSFYEVVKSMSSLWNHTAELIYKWWSSTMVDINTGLHNEPSVYLKNAQLDMLDGNGGSIWSYMLYDCWPMKVTPSDLDFSSSDIADIAVTLRYGKAKEVKPTRSSSN